MSTTRRFFGKAFKYFGVGVVAPFCGVAAAYSVFHKPPTGTATITLKDTPIGPTIPREQVAAKYDELPDFFRSKAQKFGEYMSGITGLRYSLIARAYGDVLELACGPASNLEFYQLRIVNKLVMCDISPKMIEAAKEQALAFAIERESRGNLRPKNLQLKVKDAHDMSEFADASFDTVVDTFGLCSYEDPVRVLQEMKRIVKPTGFVLLLEHGASGIQSLDNIIYSGVERHAAKYGCVHNRDIDELVKRAGLFVDDTKKVAFGTVTAVVARPIDVQLVPSPIKREATEAEKEAARKSRSGGHHH